VVGGIRLEGLSKTFRTPQGPVPAVDGIDLEIAPGETVALLGPNGAGKSTTLEMLLGLTRPDAGTVSVFGQSPERAVDTGGVGAMLQTGSLIRDLSVRELVAMIASLYRQPLPVDEALDLAGIGPLAGRRTQKLSGGETQRVRFAVAIVADPDLLVLDEPTVAMDVESRRAFWAAMRAFVARDNNLVVASHYRDEAHANADRVVFMASRAIVADGPPTEIKAMVGSRRIRATLPGADRAMLAGLPGVTDVELRGESIVLICSDSDAALRALLAASPEARDLEVTGAALEDAFVQLTHEDRAAEAA
jgi:ABC-2 type transport system ATP-binding protein